MPRPVGVVRWRACVAKGLRNGRCRHHGGLSTGPRTPEGKARGWWARWEPEKRSLYMSAVAKRQVERMKRMRAVRTRLEGTSVKAPKCKLCREHPDEKALAHGTRASMTFDAFSDDDPDDACAGADVGADGSTRC